MKNLDTIAANLFSKIRGRFPNVTLGDIDGNITNVPSDARYYDFSYDHNGQSLGKVSVNLDEETGIVVIVGKDLIKDQEKSVQDKWYNFLREIRLFAKKRMLSFDVRDINKNNLTKRDYNFLATNRPGENKMSESKMYGTSKTSYQKIGNARLAIKHSQPINLESITGRTQKIHAIYVESPDGERFKFPFKHLSGARAMARHVSEGGNAYDEFGHYISGLSEELTKLRKFNIYMNRSGVMAETLGEYTDIVKERAVTIRKEIQNLQKESYYKEAHNGFVAPIAEDVPDDVTENWIDQLTIRQFNEELKDVFPYIYRLVGEATKAKELGPEDLVAESDHPTLKFKTFNNEYVNVAPEEIEIEEAFESMMGQFSDHVCEDCGNPSWRTLSEEKQKGVDGKVCWKGYKRMGTKMKSGKRVDNCVKIKENSQSNDITEEDKAGYGTVYMRFVPKKADKETYLSAFANFANEPTDVNAGNSLRQYYGLSTKDDIANAVKKIITDKVFLNAKNVVLYKEPGVVSRFDQLKEFFEWMTSYKGDKIKVVDAPEKDQNKPEKDDTLSVEVYLPKVKKTIKVGRGSIQSDRTDDRLKTGDIVRITSGEFTGYSGSVQQINYKKEKEKDTGTASPYSNVDNREITPPEPKMTRYFTIGNTRLFHYLRQERMDLMQQYYRPNFRGFVMNDKAYKEFLKLVKTGNVFAQFGDPKIEVDPARSFSENTDVDEGIKGKLAMLALLGLTGMGAMKALNPANSPLGQALQSAAEQGDEEAAKHLKNLGAYIDSNATQTLRKLNFQYLDEPAAMKKSAMQDADDSQVSMQPPKKPKIPVSEFILSYYDRETGKFPKGETAVLTAVQKEYGNNFVKPAANFVQRVESLTMAKKAKEIHQSAHPETNMIKHLAGI